MWLSSNPRWVIYQEAGRPDNSSAAFLMEADVRLDCYMVDSFLSGDRIQKNQLHLGEYVRDEVRPLVCIKCQTTLESALLVLWAIATPFTLTAVVFCHSCTKELVNGDIFVPENDCFVIY